MFLPPPREPLWPISAVVGQTWSGNSGIVPTFETKEKPREPESLFRSTMVLNHLELVTWLGQKKRSGQKKAALTLWRELEGFRASCRQPAGSESRTRLRRRRPCPSTSQKAPATTSLDHTRPVKERIKERKRGKTEKRQRRRKLNEYMPFTFQLNWIQIKLKFRYKTIQNACNLFVI